jgi:cytochrome c-type biogenesis protein
MEDLLASIEGWLTAAPLLAFGGVFLAGIVSSFSPCVLAMIPLSIGFVGGYAQGSTRKALAYSLLFMLGLTLTFVVLGGIAAYVGGLFGLQGSFWYWILAVVAIFVGLNLWGLIRVELPGFARLKIKSKGLWGAFILGLLFGVAASPCAAPVLALVLAFAATSENVVYGMGLLLAYAIGHWLLVLVAGVSAAFAQKLIDSKKMEKAGAVLKKVAGSLLILVGLYFVYLAV